MIIWTLKTKSLLPSPAYRRAGFTKGRNYPSLAIFFLPHRQARGAVRRRSRGRFPEAYVFFIMDSLVSSSLSVPFTYLDFMVILLELA
jgi:hypothetical protein